jgi:ribosome-associated translation inhibitor RaiA
MSTLLNPTMQLLEQNREVKSFVYQMVAEFDPFVTQQTVITVVARDPKKLALQYETEGREFDFEELRTLHRIAIVIDEGGTKIEAEGVDKDIYEAIKIAKDSLVTQLVAIQDSVVSHQDRLVEINHYLQNPTLH